VVEGSGRCVTCGKVIPLDEFKECQRCVGCWDSGRGSGIRENLSKVDYQAEYYRRRVYERGVYAKEHREERCASGGLVVECRNRYLAHREEILSGLRRDYPLKRDVLIRRAKEYYYEHRDEILQRMRVIYQEKKGSGV